MERGKAACCAKDLFNQITIMKNPFSFSKMATNQVHPSYQASFDAEVWQQEFARLCAATNGIPITGGRQHYLRFRAPDTWRMWEKAGLAYDSTLSYADH